MNLPWLMSFFFLPTGGSAVIGEPMATKTMSVIVDADNDVHTGWRINTYASVSDKWRMTIAWRRDLDGKQVIGIRTYTSWPCMLTLAIVAAARRVYWSRELCSL